VFFVFAVAWAGVMSGGGVRSTANSTSPHAREAASSFLFTFSLPQGPVRLAGPGPGVQTSVETDAGSFLWLTRTHHPLPLPHNNNNNNNNSNQEEKKQQQEEWVTTMRTESLPLPLRPLPARLPRARAKRYVWCAWGGVVEMGGCQKAGLLLLLRRPSDSPSFIESDVRPIVAGRRRVECMCV